MLSLVQRSLVTPVRRFSTQTVTKKPFPFKTFADGGNRNQLQVEPKLSAYWFDFLGKPEVIPIILITTLGISLATYKTFFITTGVAKFGTLQFPEENVKDDRVEAFV